MNEERLGTIQQIEDFLSGSAAIEFSVAGDDSERYGHISRVLKRFDYLQRSKRERGILHRYLQHTSGYSRAQVTRLVTRWQRNRLAVVPLAKRYGRPAVPFVRKYTPADVALLVEMDKANEDVCGPAIVHLLQRAYQTYGDLRYERLATLSVSLLYNLRKSNGYQVQRKHFTVTRPVCNAIGVRKAPAPQGRAGFVRIDTVHQGDLDGVKGVYHITCIDAVSQWQVQACVQVFLLPVLALIIAQFPFVVQLLEDSEVAITGGFRVAAGDDEGIVAWRYGLMKHRASRQMNVEIKGIGHRFPCQPPVVQPGADS